MPITIETVTMPSGATGALYTPHAEASPTLLLLAMAGADTLATEPYCRVGRLLYERGWNVASLDLPCHGADARSGEPRELEGWAARCASGEDFVAPFRERVNELVAYLVSAGMADPKRIAAAGTSRGGFMAFHAAAGNRAIRAAAAFAPVTDLIALREFTGQERNPVVKPLALVNATRLLSHCAGWIIIGDSDTRVDTRSAVTFAQALVDEHGASAIKSADMVRVVPIPGHNSIPEWHDEAAQWLVDAIL